MVYIEVREVISVPAMRKHPGTWPTTVLGVIDMASLPDPPARRNGKTRWIDPEPRGIADWTLCVCMVVLAVPVVVVFGPMVLIVRAYDRLAGKAVA